MTKDLSSFTQLVPVMVPVELFRSNSLKKS